MTTTLVANSHSDAKLDYGKLNFLLSMKYPGTNPDEFPIGPSPLKWLHKVKSMGVEPTVAEHLLAMAMKVRIVDINSVPEKDFFFFPGGMKHISNGFVYLRNFHKFHVESPSKYGLLTGFLHRNSSKNDFAHSFTASLWARVAFDMVEDSGAEDVELSLGIINVKAGRRHMSAGFLDLTELRSHSARYVSPELLERSWGDLLPGVIERVRGGKAGRYQFLCGDYSSGLISRIKTLASCSYGIHGVAITPEWSPDSEHYGSLLLCDLDNSTKEMLDGVIYAVNHKGCYCVFVSQLGNNTELLGVFEARFGIRDILRNVGGYYIRRAIPALCKNCKKRDVGAAMKSSVISVKAVRGNIFKAGHGCSHCAEGICGVVIGKEDMSDRDRLVSYLLEVVTDKELDPAGVQLRASNYSPFSLAIKTVASGMCHSVVKLLQSGDVQLSDLDGLLY